MKHEVLYISDIDVRAMISMPAVLTEVEADFKRQSRPNSMVLGAPLAYETEDRQLGFRWRLKTAIIRDLPVAGARLTGYKIDAEGVGSGGDRNSTRYLVLSDPNTALPLAIIDDHSSFNMRTSAAMCVAAKYLARPDSRVIGLIGIGNVGQTSLVGLKELFPVAEVRVMSRTRETRNAFAREQTAELGIPVHSLDNYEEVCDGADIIMSSTPSTSPFIQYKWLKDGVFVGVMGREEACHDVFAKCDRLVVDYNPKTDKHPTHIQNAIQSGAIPQGKPIYQIWEVVSGQMPSRRNLDERIVVATVGLTTQDIAIAYGLYTQAKKEGRGVKLIF